MGTLILSLVSVPVLLAISLLLGLLSKKFTKLKRVHGKLQTYLCWNYVIQVLFESYSVLCMCVLINLRNVSS